MKKHEYSLDDLINIFEGHAKECEIEHGEGEFNLPKALYCLAKEIKELKDR